MMQNRNNHNERNTSSENDSIQPLRDLSEKLGIALIEIQAAITAVGDDPVKVERYLRDKLGLN